MPFGFRHTREAHGGCLTPLWGRGAPFGETGQALLGPAPLRETWDGSETSRDGGDAPAAVNYQEGNQTVSSLEAFLKETC